MDAVTRPMVELLRWAMFFEAFFAILFGPGFALSSSFAFA
jgi:hypothetical protein